MSVTEQAEADDMLLKQARTIKELQDKLFILEENYRILHHYAFRSNCLSGADNFKAYKDGKDE